MQYSVKIALWRMLIGYGVSGALLILGHFVAPEILDAIRPHVLELALAIGAVVLGVDFDAFRRANKQEETLSEIAKNLRGRGLVILAGLTLLPAAASAQELRYTLAYDFRSRELTPVVGIEAASLRNVAGVRGLDAAVWFPVLSYSDRRTNFGAALVAPLRLADNATLQLGAFGRITGGEKPRGGFIVGIEIR